jgi:hypothetical protein
MVTLLPPYPFEAQEFLLASGTGLFRVFDTDRSPVPTVTDFTHGWGGPSRLPSSATHKLRSFTPRNRRNTDRAFALFGDRVLASDLVALASHARIYGEPQGFNWLVDYCASLNLDILIP